MTLGPPHCATNAPPATSPPLPSSAATLEADPWTSVPTHLGLMQTLQRHCPREPGAPALSLTSKTTYFSNRRRIGKDTYEGSLCALKWPHWLANPPSASLPPTLPTVNHPPVPFPAPLPPPWAAPPTASDAPTSPVPLVLTPLPLAPRCSMPAPMPPSLPVLHLNPPSPIKAPPPFTRPVAEYHDIPGAAAPPTDPIRILPQPNLGLYPTPVNSAQLRRPPPPYPPPSGHNIKTPPYPVLDVCI
ncbi:hypothetical protein C0989_005514 [Termitomyces sp. Mn162]|nr:hypothetical protein C0989_005514 [Termitomyces sp. Mn162]